MTSRDLGDAYNTLNLSLADREEFDKYFVFTETSAATELAQRILIDREPSKNILTGIKGCGKTTELFRLGRDVEKEYVWVYCSLSRKADVRKINANDILLSVLLNLFLGSVKKDVALDEKSVKDLSVWLQEALGATRVDFEGRRLEARTLAQRIGKAMTVLRGQKIRDAVQTSLEERKGEMVERIDLLIGEMERVSGKEVLVLIDDLDKLPLERARTIFIEEGGMLTSMACKAVYTMPYSLVHTHDFRQISRYFKKYVNQGPITVKGRGSTAGKEDMIDIVHKRMDPDLMDKKALNEMIEKSGGVIADLLRCLSEACIKARTEGKDKIDGQVVEAVLDDVRKDETRTLSQEDCDVLAAVRKDSKAEYDGTFLRLLDDGYILEYADQEGVYSVHPLVVPVLEAKKAG